MSQVYFLVFGTQYINNVSPCSFTRLILFLLVKTSIHYFYFGAFIIIENKFTKIAIIVNSSTSFHVPYCPVGVFCVIPKIVLPEHLRNKQTFYYY